MDMTNNKQQTEEEKLNRIKMIIELKQNRTFLSILADFRLYKVHSMTLLDNQIVFVPFLDELAAFCFLLTKRHEPKFLNTILTFLFIFY
jgi:hypothetical protein